MRPPALILLILTAFLASCYGAQQTINIGTTPSDGTGDSLRSAFGKVNTNFTELYSLTSAINASNITTGTLPIARLADGSVTNAKLLNSGVTINGTAVNLGESISVSASTNLAGLTDVTITSAATNDFLVKSAGDWVNLTPASARTALGLSSAGGVLSGNYPNPGFAVDMVEQTELTSALSALNASNLTTGTLPIARIANASITLAKITGLGTAAARDFGTSVNNVPSWELSVYGGPKLRWTSELGGTVDVYTQEAFNDNIAVLWPLNSGIILTDASFVNAGNISGSVAISNGGTGQTTASAARIALLPSMVSKNGQFLRVNAGASDYELASLAASATTDATNASNITSGTLPIARIADLAVTNAKLAGSIALSKLAITGTADGTKFLRDDGSWQAVTGGASLAANTFTGLQQFSGTTHAGVRLNNLTEGQRDALTTSAGMVIWNTTAGRMQLHNGSAWTAGMVRLDGDTMTGALNISGGTVTASTPPLNITQTWNNAGVTFRGIEYAASNTTSNAASTLIRLLGGASGTTSAFSVTASTGSVSIGASNNSATVTLQGSDRNAVLNLGQFGNEFRVANLQIGNANASLRFTDTNASVRYGTIYGETTNVLALRNGSGGTTGSAWEMLEMTAPGTPSADRGRLYLEDNGSGKSRLVVKWADGTTTVLATQP